MDIIILVVTGILCGGGGVRSKFLSPHLQLDNEILEWPSWWLDRKNLIGPMARRALGQNIENMCLGAKIYVRHLLVTVGNMYTVYPLVSTQIMLWFVHGDFSHPQKGSVVYWNCQVFSRAFRVAEI